MEWWSILIEARGPEGAALDDHDPAIDDFMDLLHPAHHGAISASGRYWSARISFEADDAAGAFEHALDIVGKAAARAGLPRWPVVGVELGDDHEFRFDLAKPQG